MASDIPAMAEVIPFTPSVPISIPSASLSIASFAGTVPFEIISRISSVVFPYWFPSILRAWIPLSDSMFTSSMLSFPAVEIFAKFSATFVRFSDVPPKPATASVMACMYFVVDWASIPMPTSFLPAVRKASCENVDAFAMESRLLYSSSAACFPPSIFSNTTIVLS